MCHDACRDYLTRGFLWMKNCQHSWFMRNLQIIISYKRPMHRLSTPMYQWTKPHFCTYLLLSISIVGHAFEPIYSHQSLEWDTFLNILILIHHYSGTPFWTYWLVHHYSLTHFWIYWLSSIPIVGHTFEPIDSFYHYSGTHFWTYWLILSQ